MSRLVLINVFIKLQHIVSSPIAGGKKKNLITLSMLFTWVLLYKETRNACTFCAWSLLKFNKLCSCEIYYSFFII